MGQVGVHSFGYISEPDPIQIYEKKMRLPNNKRLFFVKVFHYIYILEYIYNYGIRYKEIKGKRKGNL